MKKIIYIISISLCYIFVSCSTSKNIPEDKYLLNSTEIKSDSKNIDPTYFEDFLRQTPNSTLPLFGKVRLGIYNLAGQDTSKRVNRVIQKLGQPPVIYSPLLTKISAAQIAKELSNQGYLRAEVDTTLNIKGNKISVTYDIHSKEPYTIRNYEYSINNKNISKSLRPAKKYTRVQPGMMFDMLTLDNSREHLTSYLRNIGYFNFSKELLYYKADTSLNSHQVDLYLSLHSSKDSSSFQKFKIRNVTILSGFDPMTRGNEVFFAHPDTTNYKGVKIIHGSNNFLRNSTLYRNNFIRPDKFYSDFNYTRTTGAFNGIGVIKQTDVQFSPIINSKDSIQALDAFITIVPGNPHFFQTEIEGTNSAGDLGISPSVTYQHQNIFNGAEILQLKLKGAYEFMSGSKSKGLAKQSYYEFGGSASLSFPLFLFPWLKKSWREQPSASTQVSAGLTTQHRQEYTRQFFNAGLTYRWASPTNSFNHSIDLWDITYIRMPWVSDNFREQYLENKNNPILAESYKNQLISRLAYNVTYTNSNRWGRISSNQTTIRGGIELGGTIPSLVSAFGHVKKNEDGQKEILGVAYAEYIKGDISFAQTHTLDKNNKLAYHVGLGIASPFGNSSVLPFEVRFFAGGANGVRGWRTRTLGPGSYTPNDSINDFANQVGDIKLNLSIEHRHQMTEYIGIATFIDAGNIWTIRNYEKSQPGGEFKFTEFYKQIALSYGAGLRFDLGFLLLRFDVGVQAYDPSDQKWVAFKPTFDRMAWHFAIGYPF